MLDSGCNNSSERSEKSGAAGEDGHNKGETIVFFLLLSSVPFKSILHNTLFSFVLVLLLFLFFFTDNGGIPHSGDGDFEDRDVCSRGLRDGGRDGDLGARGVRDRETLKVNLELHTKG